jgi:hypothetical protein
MHKGQEVTVLLFGGGTATRRVIADKGNVVVICTEEEFQRAKEENREPEGLGFPRASVVPSSVQSPKKGAGHAVLPNREHAATGD